MEAELYPVLHTKQWTPLEGLARRRLLVDDSHCPLFVTYSSSPRETDHYLTQDELSSSGIAPSEIESKSLKRWITQNGPMSWTNRSFPDGPKNAIGISNGNYTTSSVLLSHGHLKGVHRHFKVKDLGLIAPSRGTVIAHPDFLALAKLGRKLYEEVEDPNDRLSPLCFASYEAQVLGYVTPEYEAEFSEEPSAPEEELIELALGIVDPALVMVGANDESVLPHLSKMVEVSPQLSQKTYQQLLDTKAASTLKMSNENLNQVKLLTILAQSVYDFDQKANSAQREEIRTTVQQLCTAVSQSSGGGTFRMESVTGKHEQSSLDVVNDVLMKAT